VAAREREIMAAVDAAMHRARVDAGDRRGAR
jgi:hypothetical protein